MTGVPMRTPPPVGLRAGAITRPRIVRAGRREPRRRWRAVARAGCALLLLVVAAAAALLGLTPSVTDAPDRAVALAAQHSRGGGSATGVVPATFAAALVATEDTRFDSHHGIDTIGLLRAAGTAISGGQGDPGGSTLDQQLAKQLYFAGAQGGPWVTTEQVVLGAKLDAHYPKAQILAMYAQVVYFGHGFYGLDAAAHGYFGTSPDRLSWGQAALLAGLVQAPSADDPITHPDRARDREQHVLARLVDTGDLTPTQAAAAAATPLNLRRG